MTVSSHGCKTNNILTPTVNCLVWNAVPTWQRMLKTAQQRVLVFTPYLNTVKVLRVMPNNIPLTVYTEFSLELFASGACSLRALKEIRSWESTEVLWLPGLHAKIIVVDEQVMTIGSQNMTVRGEKNLEATALIADPETVTDAVTALEVWTKQALPITDAMIIEIERLLPPVTKLYRNYSKACQEGKDFLLELA